MTERRFHVLPADVTAHGLQLRGEESHHARRVLRLRPGDAVTCFDGEGNGWNATIDRFEGERTFASIVAPLRPEAPPRPRITLAQALVKGDRMDLILQKATELGVARVRPVAADRSDVRLDGARRDKRLERWRRIAIEAAKQSERLSLPIIDPPAPLDEVLAATDRPAIAFVERATRSARSTLGALAGSAAVTIVIGPEGGWTERERSAFDAEDLVSASLGDHILRTETAAIAALAIVTYALGA